MFSGSHQTETGLSQDYHHLNKGSFDRCKDYIKDKCFKGSSRFEGFPKSFGCVGGSRKLSRCEHEDFGDKPKTNH